MINLVSALAAATCLATLVVGVVVPGSAVIALPLQLPGLTMKKLISTGD